MRIKTDDKKIKDFLARSVDKIVTEKELITKLKSGKKLRVKHGVDPTTTDLHLGYAVDYLKMKNFKTWAIRSFS